MQRPSQRVLLRIVACAVVICVCVISYFTHPTQTKWLPQCLLYRFTGILCPGCGNTRALHALLHGRIRESLGYNVLLIPFGILFFVLLWKPSIMNRNSVFWGILATVFLFTILRNIPCYPFTLLAP